MREPLVYLGEFGQIFITEIKHNLVRHAHAQVQLIFCLSETDAAIEIKGKSHTLTINKAVCINPFESHRLVKKAKLLNLRALIINLEESWVDSALKSIEHPLIFNNPTIELDANTKKAITKLISEVEEQKEHGEANIKIAIVMLLEELTKKLLFPKRVNSQKIRRKLIDYRLRQCIELMKKNLNGQISIEDLSSKIGLSKSRIYELFQKECNAPPKIIWNSLRVNKAIEIIVKRKTALKEVAIELGYSSSANFSRSFRAAMGFSPTMLKKSSKKSTLG